MGAGNVYIKPVLLGIEEIYTPKTYYVGEEFFGKFGIFIDDDIISAQDLYYSLAMALKKKFPDFDTINYEKSPDVFSSRMYTGVTILEDSLELIKVVAFIDDYRVAFGIIPCDFYEYTVIIDTSGSENEKFAKKMGIPAEIDIDEDEEILAKSYRKFIKQYYKKFAEKFENFLKSSNSFKGCVTYRTGPWTSAILK